jgi:rhomboid protease GluP
MPQGGELALPYQWQLRVDKWKSTVRGLFGGNKEPRPKMCPACGALVGINATRCHQCGTNITFSLAALSRGLSGVFGGRAPVTTGILIVNVLMLGVSMVATINAGGGGGLRLLWGLNGEVLYRLGSTYPPAIFDGHQWWRLVTAMFLHGGLIHIGFNMMVLMDIGPVVEEVYGAGRYLCLYTVTGVAGYLLSGFVGYQSASGGHPSVGASGAILGLIGLMIAITTRRAGAQMQQLRSRLISWVVSIFVFGFLLSGVDNLAHLGGLAAGFVLGRIVADREPMSSSERATANGLGWAAAIVIIASFAMMVLHVRDPLPGS